MEFEDFLRICTTIHEKKKVKDKIFYGLINTKETEKKKFFYEDLGKEETLDKIVEFELNRLEQEFFKFKSYCKNY